MGKKRIKSPETIKLLSKIRENRNNVIKRLNNTENIKEYEELIYYYHKYNELEKEYKTTLKEELRLSA